MPAGGGDRVPHRRSGPLDPGSPPDQLAGANLAPLASLCAGALGLTFGTIFEPRTVPLLFGVIVVALPTPGRYYSWSALELLRWLQIVVLVNPLVYICEGFRAALTDVPHMSLWIVYPVLIAFTAMFCVVGVRSFTRRVLT